MFEVVLTILLLFVPGYLILNFDRNHRKGFWLSLTYSHALSLVYLITVGLVANTLLPKYGIADPLNVTFIRPIIYLSTFVLFVFSAIIGGFPLIHVFRNPKEKLNSVNPLQLILLLIFPVPTLSTIAGTLILNNGGTNTLLLVGIGLLAIQILVTSFLSNFFRHNTAFLVFSLILVATATIFMTSLRGHYVSGSDIMLEYRMAAITQVNNLWNPQNPSHPYTACLSITILPVIISNMSGISLNWVFKVILQLATIVSVVPVFFIAKKYSTEKVAYIASLAFLTFPSFFGIMPMHLRQAAAILFFFLSIHIIVSTKKAFLNQFFLYLFTFAMVISHYSTTYMATAIYLAFFFASTVFFLGSKIFEKMKKSEETDFSELHLFRHINPVFLLFLAGCIYLWYFQVTSLSVGLTNFVGKVVSSFSSDSNLDVRENTSIINQFNIFFKPTQDQGVSDEYLGKIEGEYKLNDVPGNNTFYKFPGMDIDKFQLQVLAPQVIPVHINSSAVRPLLIGADLVKKLYKVLTIAGVIFVGFSLIVKKQKKYDAVYIIVLSISFSVLIAFTTLPFFTIDYDVFRTYHQLLIVLALMPVLGLMMLFKLLRIPFSNTLTIIFFVFYFTLNTGLFYELIGGYSYSLVLDNKGDDYDRYYIQEGDVLSSKWIETNRVEFSPIHTDTYTKQKLRAISMDPLPIYDEMTEISITQKGYVYLSSANVTDTAAFKNLNNRLIKHLIPTDFIAEKKDKVYSNSSSEIYK